MLDPESIITSLFEFCSLSYNSNLEHIFSFHTLFMSDDLQIVTPVVFDSVKAGSLDLSSTTNETNFKHV